MNRDPKIINTFDDTSLLTECRPRTYINQGQRCIFRTIFSDFENNLSGQVYDKF